MSIQDIIILSEKCEQLEEELTKLGDVVLEMAKALELIRDNSDDWRSVEDADNVLHKWKELIKGEV